MPKLFNRKCVLIAGKSPPNNFVQVVPTAIKIEDLRIDFSIEKDDKPQPNRCSIQVYNLTPLHRGQLDQKGIRVILQAGYEGTIAQIFSGDARFINSDKVGPDWITKFECGDAERAYTFARVSQSFGAGTTVKDVIGAVVNQLQVDPGNALQVAQKMSRSFANGYVAQGTASTELTRLLEPAGFDWSIQDGRIEVLGLLDTVTAEVPLISATTGMVGSPEFGTGEKLKGPAFLKVKSLLQPRLRPGQKFEIRSRSQNGFFKCRKVRHVGSTHGGDWYSEIEAIGI